ncbi:MAG: homoserine dehydrogenase [Pseudomonadota bacterium]|nr:MAG: homoserine dehydrogenase [Pseudomonadota bacterium]
MSGVERLSRRGRYAQAVPGTAVGLIGSGKVGSRVLSRLADQRPEGVTVVGLANSRRMLLAPGDLAAPDWKPRLAAAGARSDIERLAAHVGRQPHARHVIVDVTGSRAVAERHPGWLADGFAIVTANKWAACGPAASWARLDCSAYFDATTVGAGLPILDALRALRRAGDRVERIDGVLSGTLSALLAEVANGRSFADSLLRAHRDGLTEPDPRLDLGGMDVARKLVIAARAGGLALELDEVEVQAWLDPDLAGLPLPAFLAAHRRIDDAWSGAVAAAPGQGEMLCHVGEVARTVDGAARARVGLRRVSRLHPFAAIGAGENIVAIHSAGYAPKPIWIRGPGAGAGVTALQICAGLAATARQ